MSCGGGHLGFSIGIKKQKLGRSSTKCKFYMPIGNPRWPPLQDID
jgi:hypothetical protein